MRIINTSYEVLADPDRRRAHDTWIATQEAKGRASWGGHAADPEPPAARQPQEPHPPPTSGTQRPSAGGQPSSKPRAQSSRKRRWSKPNGWDVLVGGLVLSWIVFFVFEGHIDGTRSKESDLGVMGEAPEQRPRLETTAVPVATATPVSRTEHQQSATDPDAFVRYRPPATAPNGQPWPSGPAYVPGYPVDARQGVSELTINNGRNTSPVFVRLYALDRPTPAAVRQFFIPPHSSFTASSLSPGNYDVRYRDLETGGLVRSETFQIEEIPTANGVRYTSMEITLYKVADGNFQTYPLDEADF